MKIRVVKKRHRGVDITFGDFLIEYPATYGVQERVIKQDLRLLHSQAIRSVKEMIKLFPKDQAIVISWQVRSVPKSRRAIPGWKL